MPELGTRQVQKLEHTTITITRLFGSFRLLFLCLSLSLLFPKSQVDGEKRGSTQRKRG
jgi:hypothetical protein